MQQANRSRQIAGSKLKKACFVKGVSLCCAPLQKSKKSRRARPQKGRPAVRIERFVFLPGSFLSRYAEMPVTLKW